MRTVFFTLILILTIVTAKAESGERPSKDTNQKVTKLALPNLDATVIYEGGDTLYLDITTENDEPVKIKLLGGSTTLLNDGLKRGNTLRRIYVISAFPEGEYKIRLKKGNYVVEKKFTKTTAANPVD
jgi:hypothetical protein